MPLKEAPKSFPQVDSDVIETDEHHEGERPKRLAIISSRLRICQSVEKHAKSFLF